MNRCSPSKTRRLSQTDKTVDEIMGLGRQSRILAFGTPVMPDVVFTPLVKLAWHYNVNLESISIIVQTLTIDHSVFALSDHQPGIIIDSGTTLVYITEEAYTPVVDVIKHAASNFIQPLMSSENFCY
ncbi:unnamed protein product [Lactuca saligna]|uniref:Xylanase inhibitor C-terminal domain-containing protein n=1 Tax=Lactuca saligna TaxID=75948 RepID=A0AA35YE18_LACSI|nr:unnamed protein product [Lactuca saligna]